MTALAGEHSFGGLGVQADHQAPGRLLARDRGWSVRLHHYELRGGGFYPWRISGGEGNLRLTCPDGTQRMTGRIEWAEMSTGADGRFEGGTGTGMAIEGKLTGRNVRGPGFIK